MTEIETQARPFDQTDDAIRKDAESFLRRGPLSADALAKLLKQMFVLGKMQTKNLNLSPVVEGNRNGFFDSTRSREQEIENIKRLLASISQRLDALK